MYTHQFTGLPVTKNGYLYVFVSNEPPNIDVFFDNLQVTHIKGPLLEETHYYPFGLTMAGISSKAAGITRNKEKTFQGQRFDDELDLNWMQFKWRNHDPQIGRFVEIDPLSDKYVYNSPYAFSENQVTAHIELEGLEKLPINPTSTSTQPTNYLLPPPIIFNRQPAPVVAQTKSAIQFTATTTLGLSVGGDFEIKGTPVTMGMAVSTKEVDVVGMRDNTFVAMGHELNGDRTGVSRKGGGVTLMGAGVSSEVETSRPKSGGPMNIEKKESLITPVGTVETTQLNNGPKQTNTYLGAGFKLSFFVGVELGVKVQVNGNNSAAPAPLPHGQAVDNSGRAPLNPNLLPKPL